METPKEKAISLIEKYQQIELLSDFDGMDDKLAIECSIIAVSELIEECKSFGYWNQSVGDKCATFYQEVKSELETLKTD